MPPKKTKYTLQVYNLNSSYKVDEIHTESILECEAVNRSLQIVDTAKKKGKFVEVVIKKASNQIRIGLVTPDEITLE